MEPFGVRLRATVAARGPLCAGIDPHADLLREWGLGDDLAGLERFTRIAVEALADRVALVKPQSAFFERFGSRGIAVLEGVVADARAAGALVLLDVKRGDIGSTVAAYAAAYLDPASTLAADAVTASPYLGVGSLRPLFHAARAAGAGVFVLARTSNPEGAEVQHATGPGGRTVAQLVVDIVGELNAAELAPHAAVAAAGIGSVGVVVGATLSASATAGTVPGIGWPRPGRPAVTLSGLGWPEPADRSTAVVLDSLGSGWPGSGWTGAGGGAGTATVAPTGSTGLDLSDLRGPILAPGIGAQGATLADLPALFGGVLPNVLPSVSRELLRHGPNPVGLRAAVGRLADEAAALVATATV